MAGVGEAVLEVEGLVREVLLVLPRGIGPASVAALAAVPLEVVVSGVGLAVRAFTYIRPIRPIVPVTSFLRLGAFVGKESALGLLFHDALNAACGHERPARLAVNLSMRSSSSSFLTTSSGRAG